MWTAVFCVKVSNVNSHTSPSHKRSLSGKFEHGSFRLLNKQSILQLSCRLWPSMCKFKRSVRLNIVEKLRYNFIKTGCTIQVHGNVELRYNFNLHLPQAGVGNFFINWCYDRTIRKMEETNDRRRKLIYFYIYLHQEHIACDKTTSLYIYNNTNMDTQRCVKPVKNINIQQKWSINGHWNINEITDEQTLYHMLAGSHVRTYNTLSSLIFQKFPVWHWIKCHNKFNNQNNYLNHLPIIRIPD